MIKTYTYKIKNSSRLMRKFSHWIGICRYVYNIAKETKEESYKKGLRLSNYDLQKQFTDAKKDHKWLYDVHSDTLTAIFDRLEKSFLKFYNGAGYPKWASKKEWNSIPFKYTKIKNGMFSLPGWGVVNVFKFKTPKGELRKSFIVNEIDGLYLKIVVNEPDIDIKRDSQSIVSIDMGIKYFLTTSDSEFVENPKYLFKNLKKLRIANRKLSRMKKGGSNWKNQVIVLKRIHQKIKRCRMDFIQKESSKLSRSYDYIIRENLNISGMIKGNLSKHISDCGWRLFFDVLEYKSKVIKVSPHYSSQECSKCGHTCKDNRKTQSLFECVKCGYTENADLQATFNLLKRGQSLLEANVNQ